MGHRTEDVWATPHVAGKNVVRQLLVPAYDNVDVLETDSGLEVVNTPFGQWPVARAAELPTEGPLAARLPVRRSKNAQIRWEGGREPVQASDVIRSFDGAIGFTAHDQPHSLRRPQIAALHSIVGYQSSGLSEPGIVVMPTGTGKTETMLAWLVAQRPERVLVVVPSTALRDQIATKFETLGILQIEGIVDRAALRPRVGRLEGRFADDAEARAFVEAANVVVATPNAIHANEPEVREAFFQGFTHLLVDEAHHAPARTWTEIIRVFADRPTLLFTATPFRRDGLTLPGRVIFRFPLREAQTEGYFSTIDFTAVLDLDDDDEALAEAAVTRLREDLAAGHEHLLLARVGTKTRADEVHALYSRLAPEFTPKVIYDSMSARRRAETLKAMRDRTTRVIVCVDMLGEGFDLPTLKVGAFHDAHRSLSPMVQLIGRLARTSSPLPIGRASVFVRQDPRQALSPMRFLLREDPDWDKVLSDITERATERANEVSEFEASFVDNPPDVPVGLLEPKMSAKAFAISTIDWNPLAARDIYGDSVLDDLISVNTENTIAWFVIETIADLRWGDIPSLRATDYTLVALYRDRVQSLLYVHCSDTKHSLDDLVEAVLGHEPRPVNGYDTFKVFSKLDRLIPTNIGLLDARDRDKRFSMHVGSDVETALTEAERTHKANTHVAAKAFEEGDRVTIAASLSGRFWSMRTAPNFAEWRTWCQQQGAKLRDGSVDIHSIFRSMIIPIDVKERPTFPILAMEWPWDLYLGNGTSSRLGYKDSSVLLTDAEFRIDDYGTSGPLRFSIMTPTWELAYEGQFGSHGLHYNAVGDDAEVVGWRDARTPFSAWLNNHKPTLFLSGDRMVTGDDRLLAPRTELPPYPREQLRALDWVGNGVDITVESQGIERKTNSIQAYVSRYLSESRIFDVLIDDDRSGEAADLVGIRAEKGDLHITLVHCKYSSKPTAGSRLNDLYEVCGQAMRGARWRDNGALPLLEHLDRRAKAYTRRTGLSPFEIGDREALFRIRQKAPQLFPRVSTVIAQPGLSIKASSDEQLRLIAGAASYVQSVTKGTLDVYAST
ncbi:MAG TPA: DEAD/DEAH box helicase family protein [Dermatophilaceae bacterium]|nr:DEAD/DEAH box helicase family protein [Dermatophilaceae bacterium]